MMTRRRFNQLAVCGAALTTAGLLPTRARAATLDTVRLGWANTANVDAQVFHVLKNTDIAERNGLKLEMHQLANSPAISEGMASGAIDIGSVSDFSAVTMMAAGAPIIPIGQSSMFRSAVMVTKLSGITSMAGLKGKSIYGLFGITAYLNAQAAVKQAGLVPGKDVTFVNIAAAELSDAVRAGKVEAFFTWDPWSAMFENSGLGIVISQDLTPAMILQVHRNYLDKQPGAVRKLLKSHSEALYYASQNHDLVNSWYRTLEPAKSIPLGPIEKASAYDPQWTARSISSIKVALSPEEIGRMDAMARWGVSEKLLPRMPDVKNIVNTSIGNSVDQELSNASFDASSVRIIHS
jgi:sulfonate transport system substrate-binding protein